MLATSGLSSTSPGSRVVELVASVVGSAPGFGLGVAVVDVAMVELDLVVCVVDLGVSVVDFGLPLLGFEVDLGLPPVL